jgi:hypothetical protein
MMGSRKVLSFIIYHKLHFGFDNLAVQTRLVLADRLCGCMQPRHPWPVDGHLVAATVSRPHNLQCNEHNVDELASKRERAHV